MYETKLKRNTFNFYLSTRVFLFKKGKKLIKIEDLEKETLLWSLLFANSIQIPMHNKNCGEHRKSVPRINYNRIIYESKGLRLSIVDLQIINNYLGYKNLFGWKQLFARVGLFKK